MPSELELGNCRMSELLLMSILLVSELLKLTTSSGSEPEVQAKNENMDAIAPKKNNVFEEYIRIFIPPE